MASSSSSSSITSPWCYDVFLSFRGEDTRNTFTAHLYHALSQKGICTFKDEDEVKRGDEISPALLQAIEGSRISIIVLSTNYASSTWCLDELLKILECKKSKQQIVLPVFYHVNPSDVRHQRRSFRKALAKHAGKLNVDHNKLQLWEEALQEVASMSGYHLINGNESQFIEQIVQEVSRIANDHFFLPVAKHPVGLEPHLKDVNLLLSVETNDIRMIGIFGVGGIVKTTLAKAIYNLIAFRFEARCFLAIVSDTSNQADRLVRLQKTLLPKILGKCKSLKIDSIETGIINIKRGLYSKRVLLILDSVDHLSQLETLAGTHDWFGKGSRIIITTRNQHLLKTHRVDSTYEMMGLNQNDAFQLFCWHAFKREIPDDGFGEFVERIVNYTGRLPLALTVLGSDLYGRSERLQWVSAMDEYRQIPHQDIQKILQTSFDRLRENEKKVFLDIACFFNGQVRLDDVITKMLDSFGFEPNFSIPRLKEKCLISEFDGKLQMHALLRDMGREVVRKESPENPEARSRLFFHDHVQEVLQEDTNLMVMNFRGCGLITELSDVSRCPNLKKINLRDCTSLVKVHDSVGLLGELVKLNLAGCSNLRSFPRRLQLRSLGFLDLSNCSSLQYFPEIECEMKHLGHVDLTGTAIEELPSSIGYITGLGFLDLSSCVNLKCLPSSIYQLRSLGWLDLSDCPNIISFGMEEEVLCRLFFDGPTKSITDLELHLKNSGLSKSNFFSFRLLHGFFLNLTVLDLSGSDIVSIPASVRTFRRLSKLILNDCRQLKEIKEFPWSLSVLRANGCISLESLPVHWQRLWQQQSSIKLARCYKVNMGNLMPNPAWYYDANMIFPGNEIPFWFSNCKEISNDHRCEFDIKGSPPYNFDGLIGIALCAVIEPVGRFWSVDMMIGSVAYDSDHYVGKFDEMDSDHVWLRYLSRQDVKHKRGIRLDQELNELGIRLDQELNELGIRLDQDVKHKRGIWLDQEDNLRIIFESSPKSVILKRCGVHLFYKQHEQQRRPVDCDDDCNKPVSTLDIELFLYTSDMCHSV